MAKKRYSDNPGDYKKSAFFRKRNKIKTGGQRKARSPVFSFDLGFKFFGRQDEYD